MNNSLTHWKRPTFKICYLRNSQISVWNTNFFSRQAIAKNLFVLDSSYTGDTPYWVWFDLNNSLTRWKRPTFKIRYLRKSQISVWNTNFFPRQAIAKILFVSDSSYTWDTPYRVWFDLDDSLTRWKRPTFKIRYLRKSQISVWKTNFFPRQAIAKILSVLDPSYTRDTPYQVWFDLNNSLTHWKRPTFKIRYLRNSHISVWKINFFPSQAIAKILFVLDSSYTGNTRYRVWFDLDNSLTRWKRPTFKIRYLRKSQISVWNTNFFPRQAIAKNLFVLDSSYTWDTPYRVWFDLDDSLTRWKRPTFKIRYLRNSQISVWNTNFFPRQAIAKNLFVLDSSYTGDTPYRVWFDLNNSLTRWKRPTFKIRYLRKSQISVWNTNFFPRQAIAKILFVSDSSYTWDTLYRVWFDLDDSLTRWKRPTFKFVICEIRKFPYEIRTFFLGKL